MVEKVNPRNIQANWQPFEKRAPWGFISSRELSIVFGIHLQTIANWRIRGILPEAEPHRRGIGNKVVYKISKILRWLDPSLSEDEIYSVWIQKYLPAFSTPLTLEQAQELIRYQYRALEVEQV